MSDLDKNQSPTLMGQLIIAQPQSRDPYFQRSVIVVCSHSDQGAWGLVVNKPLMDLDRSRYIWQCLGFESGEGPGGEGLWEGGPVLQERIICLHSADWRGPATQELIPGVLVTQDPAIFQALHQGQGPSVSKFFTGFSSWGPGQLDGEQQGQPPWQTWQTWLTAPSSRGAIMSLGDQDEQWHRAIQRSARAHTAQWF